MAHINSIDRVSKFFAWGLIVVFLGFLVLGLYATSKSWTFALVVGWVTFSVFLFMSWRTPKPESKKKKNREHQKSMDAKCGITE